jgi:hypothetical protein
MMMEWDELICMDDGYLDVWMCLIIGCDFTNPMVRDGRAYFSVFSYPKCMATGLSKCLSRQH